MIHKTSSIEHRKRFVPTAVSRLLLASLLLTAHCSLLTAQQASSLLTAHGSLLTAQQVVDKMVETVNAGVIPDCRQVCLITYSDLLWQLALQPNTPLENPTSVDLNRALHL